MFEFYKTIHHCKPQKNTFLAGELRLVPYITRMESESTWLIKTDKETVQYMSSDHKSECLYNLQWMSCKKINSLNPIYAFTFAATF